MQKQNRPTGTADWFHIYAGGQPWVLVAVLHDPKRAELFCRRHRAVHPFCPLMSIPVKCTVQTTEWTILD